MYYVVNGSVYAERDGKFVNVEITGKDKVVEIRELESVTVTDGDIVLDSVGDAIPCSISTIIAKFNISEKNPVLFAKPAPKKAAKKTSKKAVKETEEEEF